MSTGKPDTSVGVTDTNPEPVIGFTPPEGCQRYCSVAIWASTGERFEELRDRALDMPEFEDARTGDGAKEQSVCCWLEGETRITLYAGAGYTRPVEHSRSEGAF